MNITPPLIQVLSVTLQSLQSVVSDTWSHAPLCPSEPFAFVPLDSRSNSGSGQGVTAVSSPFGTFFRFSGLQELGVAEAFRIR